MQRYRKIFIGDDHRFNYVLKFGIRELYRSDSSFWPEDEKNKLILSASSDKIFKLEDGRGVEIGDDEAYEIMESYNLLNENPEIKMGEFEGDEV